jgi:hypothetical protein
MVNICDPNALEILASIEGQRWLKEQQVSLGTYSFNRMLMAVQQARTMLAEYPESTVREPASSP